MGPILLKPESRGQITLRSADPHDKPIIDPRYLTDAGGVDRAALMAGLRMCAEIAEAPALKRPASARSPGRVRRDGPRRRDA